MKRFDIRLRLGAAFCLLAAALFIVGWQGVHQLRQLDREMREVIYDRWSEEQIVREAFRLSNLNSRITLSVFLLDDPDEIQRLLVQRATNTDRISGLIRAIEPRLDTEEEKRLFAAVEAARKPYIESYLQALAKLVDEHQRDEARKMMAEVTLPRIAVYHAAWNAFTQCQVDEIEQAIKQNKADFATAQRRLLFLVILAGLIAVAIAGYVIFRVTREIAERERAEEALRQSYDQLEQRVQQRTAELGKTNQALHAEITERKRMEEVQRTSEARFSTVFRASPLSIAISRLKDGAFVDVNGAWEKVTGFTREETIGRKGVELKIWVDAGQRERLVRNMRERGPIQGFEVQIRQKSGAVRDMLISAEQFDFAGEPCMLTTAMDITERKQIEEALQRQKTELRVLFDWMPAIVWFKDTENRILRANKRAAEIVGKPVEEIEGKPSLEIFPQEAAKYYSDDLEVIHSGAPKLGIVETLRDRDGKEQWGQTDKVPVCDQDGKVTGIIVMTQDITERKRAEEALRASQQILEGIINAIPVRVFWKDKNLVYLGCNAIFARDAGFADPKDIIGKDDFQMGWREQAEKYRGDDRQVIESGCSKLLIEEPQTTPEGNTITLLSSKIPLRSSQGEISGLLGTYMDITGRKRLEAQLLQSQKMETVGKLTGGIAHEFNSILTTIIGHSEFLLNDLPGESPLANNATEISKAAGRAAMLTRQLLAYGRKQFLQPETLDLNQVITDMEGVFQHLMGKDVDTRIVPAPGLQAVRADAGQIEQVIMNLAINARDAMPGGGKLTLETANVSFDQDSVGRSPEMKPGDYVMLAITDTGTGMSAEVKAHVFEPFFSTKGVGQGAGLGLSTCYGIVKQSGGYITVYSEFGRGTAFKIYLPRVEPAQNSPPASGLA